MKRCRGFDPGLREIDADFEKAREVTAEFLQTVRPAELPLQGTRVPRAGRIGRPPCENAKAHVTLEESFVGALFPEPAREVEEARLVRLQTKVISGWGIAVDEHRVQLATAAPTAAGVRLRAGADRSARKA
ncbi:MAG: hypothetical protein ACXWFQ_00380 [Thermoanaerobaculia bacterium]